MQPCGRSYRKPPMFGIPFVPKLTVRQETNLNRFETPEPISPDSHVTVSNHGNVASLRSLLSRPSQSLRYGATETKAQTVAWFTRFANSVVTSLYHSDIGEEFWERDKQNFDLELLSDIPHPSRNNYLNIIKTQNRDRHDKAYSFKAHTPSNTNEHASVWR